MNERRNERTSRGRRPPPEEAIIHLYDYTARKKWQHPRGGPERTRALLGHERAGLDCPTIFILQNAQNPSKVPVGDTLVALRGNPSPRPRVPKLSYTLPPAACPGRRRRRWASRLFGPPLSSDMHMRIVTINIFIARGMGRTSAPGYGGPPRDSENMRRIYTLVACASLSGSAGAKLHIHAI